MMRTAILEHESKLNSDIPKEISESENKGNNFQMVVKRKGPLYNLHTHLSKSYRNRRINSIDGGICDAKSTIFVDELGQR